MGGFLRFYFFIGDYGLLMGVGGKGIIFFSDVVVDKFVYIFVRKVLFIFMYD